MPSSNSTFGVSKNNNRNTKTNHIVPKNVNIMYYVSIVALSLIATSFIPFIIDIEKTKYTQNIPYVTLFFLLFACLIILGLVGKNKYYIPLLLLIVFFICNLYVIFLKVRYETKESYTNINSYTPSNNLQQTYNQFYTKTMCRGKDKLNTAGQRIDWKNANLQGPSTCRFKNQN